VFLPYGMLRCKPANRRLAQAKIGTRYKRAPATTEHPRQPGWL